MRLHHVTTAVVTLLTLLTLLTATAVLSVGGGVAQAGAAAQHPAHPAAAPPASTTVISTKIVLPETSIDGPGLSSVVGTFEGRPFNKSVIAWTGTDLGHHLNVETSADGLHFANKRTLRETSPFRPDVTQIGAPAGGQITV